MTDGSQVTGTRDEHYDLVSVLYHILQAGDTYQQYIDDARTAGDDELAGFFEELQRDDRQRAGRAKQLLLSRLGRGTQDPGAVPQVGP